MRWKALLLTVLIGGASLLGASASQAEEVTLLQHTADAREAASLPAFTTNERLTELAQTWAEHMASTGKLESDPAYAKAFPEGALSTGQTVGVAEPQEEQVTGLFKLWMTTEDARARVLSPLFTDVGVGQVTDKKGKLWAVQLFAQYAAVASPSPTPTPSPSAPVPASPAPSSSPPPAPATSAPPVSPAPLATATPTPKPTATPRPMPQPKTTLPTKPDMHIAEASPEGKALAQEEIVPAKASGPAPILYGVLAATGVALAIAIFFLVRVLRKPQV